MGGIVCNNLLNLKAKQLEEYAREEKENTKYVESVLQGIEQREIEQDLIKEPYNLKREYFG